MKLKEIRQTVAENLNYLDENGEINEADISPSTIDRYINNRYLFDIFPAFSKRTPNFFTQNAHTPTYQEIGTADSASTGTTLISTNAIFTNDMVGAKVRNITDDVVATIIAFTDSITVTLDTTINDTWDGDTIRVFTGLYTLRGDISDVSSVLWVGIQYDIDDALLPTTDHRRAHIIEDEDTFSVRRGRRRQEGYSKAHPRYIFQSVTSASVPTSAIKILPIPDEVIETGVFIRYTQQPEKLVEDTDEPRLPEGHDLILAHGATADCLLKIERTEDSRVYDNSTNKPWQGDGKYNIAFKNLLDWNGAERVGRAPNFGRSTESFLTRNGHGHHGNDDRCICHLCL